MPSKKTDLKARLLATFQVEAQEHLQTLGANLLALDRGLPPAEAREVLEKTFRGMHTLKGAARTVGMTEVENLCQDCESLLSRIVRENLPLTRATLDQLRESADRLARLLGAGDHQGGQDSLRVDKGKFDALLLQVEGLLGSKLAAEERVREAGALIRALARHRETLEEGLGRGKAPGGNGKGTEPRPALQKAVKDLESLARQILGHLRADQRALSGSVDTLLEEVRTIRMMPASSILDVFPLMAHDLARKEGKEVEWAAQGAEHAIDRKVLEAIKEPLIHLVRNAIDHGIEPPDARVAAGKSPAGRVTVTVTALEKGRIEIRVEDDGRGIDPVLVREAAVRNRLIAPEEAQRLSDDQALALVCRSGVSTSPRITDISGHGLGLAIVKEQVERFDGSLTVVSRPGEGTSVRMVLPATIATFRGLLVRAGGQSFLLPTEAVVRVLRVAPEKITGVEGPQSLQWEGAPLALAPLSGVLGLPSDGKTPETPPRLSCVLVKSGERRGALVVDQILGDREVLVKELGWPLVRARHVAGAGVLGTGELVLILRPSDLLKTPGGAP